MLGGDELARYSDQVAGILRGLDPADRRTVLRTRLGLEDRDENARLECKACAKETELGTHEAAWHTCPERRVPL